VDLIPLEPGSKLPFTEKELRLKIEDAQKK
jgi:hypothetical protein